MQTKVMVVTVLIMVLLVSIVAGCNSQKGESITSKEGEKKHAPEKLQNPDITIVSHHPIEDPVERMARSFAAFEQKYGGKINYLQTPSNDKTARLISLITAGDSPDVVNLGGNDMPSYVIKGLIQPVDTLVDFDDPVWIKEAMKRLNYKGNIWGISRDVAVWFVFL